MLRSALLILSLYALPLSALPIEVPSSARQTAQRDSDLAQVAVPVAPFAGTTLQTRSLEGPVQRRAFRLTSTDLTPLQLLAPLRSQLASGGYEILLDCDQDSCGGFDFRFAIDVLPAPNMYVNIRDYHFVSATRGGSAIMLLGSTTQGATYLQIIAVGEDTDAGPEAPAPAPPQSNTDDASSLTERLLAAGSAILNGIDFAVGATTLSEGPAPELAELAALLQDRPGLQVAVVGHTDTTGTLAANIEVSRARAASVRNRLIDTYGISGDRIEAAGMGYLAPRASNLLDDGRRINRRVEVILLREDAN